jgi:chemotaxis signal transduction protein
MQHGEGEASFSPSPVMTFQVSGDWLAVRVEQVDRVAMAPRLWPVPMAHPQHIGLYDTGQELVPVLCLDGRPTKPESEQMLAILQVRGESVGLAIDRAGRVYDRYRFDDAPAPATLRHAQPRRGVTADARFWVLDADRLFAFDEAPARTSQARGT